MPLDFHLKKTSGDQWYWTLIGVDGRAVARSAEEYVSREKCLENIRAVKKDVSGALVWDFSGKAMALVPLQEFRAREPAH
jgi:uncharacterized protein YegP (UPF0339 family)